MKHCYDMFWDCCLHKSSLDHLLYTNKTELYKLYQNDIHQDHDSPYGLRTLKHLSISQWSFIIRKTDYQTSSIIPKKGLEVTAFDDDMHFVLLSTVCPLYKSVQVVTENQMKISRIAVEHGINNDDYEKIWELMEKKLNTMSSHCNCAGYFKPKLDTMKKSTFNREQTRDNRKYILDSTFDNQTLLKDSEFVDRVQNELKLIKEEETKSSICRHCARKISFSLDNGKYIPGSYPSALADLATSGNREGCQSGVFGEHAYPEIKFPASGYITFNPPFTAVPALVYGLYLYDTSKDSNSRLVTDVTNLSKSGFNMKIKTYADTKMWGARISWMACPKATVNV
ncbi:unnamed protein product [Mytilus edulis]|uniref:H-type lectin domain-containing protein n=1 Tax=Mytilus edulis TaxID=6550 RepID=A0A8S3TSX8_MYTED|nr:unnamed protein product [Mytilus edulis]